MARGTSVRKRSGESSNMHWTSESLDKDMTPKRWDRPLLIECLHWLWWINHSKWWTVFFVDYLRRNDKMLVMWEIWWSTLALLHARLKLYRFTEKDRWRASRLCTPVNEDACILSNFNHLLEIDAYSTQWMDDTHMRHIKYFRTERITVYVYILIMISIGQYLYCTCRSHTFVCAWNFLYQPKRYLDMKVRFRIFQSNPCRAEAVMHKYRLLSKKGLGGVLQPRPKRASQEPIYRFFAKNQNQFAFAINDPSYECYIPNV